MLDATMIQTRGFRNGEGGFQVRLRLPYYRGVWANLVDSVTIRVDGEACDPGSIRWTIAGTSYTAAQLSASADARWPVDQAAVLTVPRDAPLSIGMHTVAAELRLRMSYIPEELQPTVWSEERRLVITR